MEGGDFFLICSKENWKIFNTSAAVVIETDAI